MTRFLFTRWFVLMIISGLLLASCASAASPNRQAAYETGGAPAPAAPKLSSQGKSSEGYAASGPSSQPIERLVIKNGTLTLVVIDPSKSLEAIAKLAEEMGGYVVTANLSEAALESGAKVPQGEITIRVPAERLNEALGKIKAESSRPPVSERIESQDVTSEYTDLASRLRNLEAAEAQLTEIMKSATKTEDVLNVYNQLVQVREQIEVTKGQMKYYEQSAALSSVSVTLLANEAVQPLTIGNWQPQGVAKDALRALIGTLKFLANAVIWILLYLLPVGLVLYVVFVLPISFIWRTIRRRRAAKKAVLPPAAPSDTPPA